MKMKLYIELVFLILIPLLILVLWMFYRVSKRRLIRKYDPEKDKGRLAEIRRTGRAFKEEQGDEEESGIVRRTRKLERRESISQTTPDRSRKDKPFHSKNGSRLRRILRRRKRRK